MLNLRSASRRQLTLIIAGAGVVIALAAAALLPVPYVILSPGPTLNTLGRAGKHELIAVSGRRTYPVNGHLNLVTVSFQGGPSDHFNLFTALQAWLTPHYAVVPEQELFGPGQSQQQVTRQDTQQMVSSQETATAAALCQLGVGFTTLDTVLTTEKGMPAASALRKGDVIKAVDGTPVTCRHTTSSLIRARRPGSAVTLTISHGQARRQVRLRTVPLQGHTVIGVTIGETYRFPFHVKIDVGQIGGPSAGLMFALGIVDKLSPANLTNGRFIAGTGELASASGEVEPIGGIQQKLAAARVAGATVFLTPAANCHDAAGAVPAGLRLVKVSTLRGAVGDLQALATGKPVPSC
ncbi:MAG TPA: PDZ domain-containing protein [Streptosporangiaceae bacterium]|nr:PDZ domain-containing protein [Streptosporangiaceae bacterium]